MTTTQAPEKTPNAFQRGVNAVIDLLSSFFLPIINLLVSVGILKGILTLLQVSGMVTDDSTTYAILNAMAAQFGLSAAQVDAAFVMMAGL